MFTKVFKFRLKNLQSALSALSGLAAILVVAAVLNTSVVFQVLAYVDIANSQQFITTRQQYSQSNFTLARNYFQQKTKEYVYQFDTKNTFNKQTIQPNISKGAEASGIEIRKQFLAKQEAAELKRLEELERQKKILSPNAKILLVGDSMIKEHTGIVFERRLAELGFEVIRDSKYSTGFTNTAYFNWTQRIQQLVSIHKPEAVIVYMGANDGQKIYSETDSRYYNFEEPQWENEYRKNVSDFVKEATFLTKHVYLIGHSISPLSDFNSKFTKINGVFAELESEFKTLQFVDVWSRFAPNGRFERILGFNGVRQYVKFEDGIHLTEHGSEITFDELKTTLKKDMLGAEIKN